MSAELPVEDVLELLDQTLIKVSKTAVDFAAGLGEDSSSLPCQYQWHKLEKAARTLISAREIENESFAALSVANAEKELIKRAVALMDCLRIAEGDTDPAAPNLRYPGRKTRKRPWGRTDEDDWAVDQA